MILFLIPLGCATDAPETDTGFCSDAPVATYHSFGAGFLQEHCQSCHASSAPNRNGAPEGIRFDDESLASAHYAQILSTAGSDSPTMPPQGGITEGDKAMLNYWLLCEEGLR